MNRRMYLSPPDSMDMLPGGVFTVRKVFLTNGTDQWEKRFGGSVFSCICNIFVILYVQSINISEKTILNSDIISFL